MISGFIVCERCEQETPRRSYVQRYCRSCSAIRNVERTKGWAKSAKAKQSEFERKSAVVDLGKRISGAASRGFFPETQEPCLIWAARIAVPFDWAASKNHIYSLRAQGHTELREGSKALQGAVERRLRQALNGFHVAHNRVWVSIFVQKPNHRGDAINVVDIVCDGVKKGVGIDDRWFSLRSVDWEIVKVNPRIFITVGQEDCEDALACSHCGRIQPLNHFQRSKSGPMGHSRACKECSAGRVRDQRKKAPALLAERAP